MRINLNYDWKFNDNFEEGYISPDFDDSGFTDVNIPHCNKELPYNNFDESDSAFVSCYRKKFYLPDNCIGKKLILQFEAVAHYAKVYVNGVFAFKHKGGYTAFEGDVTELLKVGAMNTISVMVDSREREEIPPFGGVVDYLGYGGIYREVYLHVHSLNYITGVYVKPQDCLNRPKIDLKLDFNDAATATAKCKIVGMDGVIAHESVLDCIGDAHYAKVIEIDNPVLWSTQNPYLYTYEIEYNDEVYTGRFGLREAIFKKNGFFLNGKPLKIRGLNRHQSYPYVGYAMPASAQIADADYLKNELGVNLVRTAHYPNSRHFLDRCDELGLLVFTEIPGWQHVGKEEEWRDITLQHVSEMITQAYNHPSIVLWGVRINESGDDNELYKATNALAHNLDDSRQTGGVRCFPQSKLYEDVYTFNDFIHSGNNRGLLPKFVVCSPNVPLLITEHNGHMFPTKSFDHEKKRQEHALRHAKVLDTAYKRKNTAGAIGWCMSDYNTHKDFGSGDKICYHGVSDMFRINKLAGYFYASQQDERPVLEISSNMEIGDNAGGQVGDVYMFTNCDSVKLYKSGKLINTFDIPKLAQKSPYKHLPHPPVKLFDIIGTQLEELGRFTKHGAKRLKAFLLAIKAYGTIPAILRMPFTVLGLMIRYRLSIEEITSLFGTYVTNWGAKAVSYKFEGIKDGKTVTVEKASVTKPMLSAEADSDTLIEGDTYDVTRIKIRALSDSGNVLPYSNDTIRIITNGVVDVIGDTSLALIGGQRGVWVKTTGKSGKAVVEIQSTLGNACIELDVKKTTKEII